MNGTILGLRANWRQFTLLVIVNAFVGAMVGVERAVLPAIAATEFRIASTTAVLAFIAAFGFAKAATNLMAGWLADRGHRRRTLLAGWLFGIPVPFLILWAPSWGWIVAANLLLGINQGLAWSATVIMKIDLVGPRRRGFAMGLNEFSGYLAVGVAGLAAGYAAVRFGMRPGTAYLGVAIAAIGLLLSWFTRDTAAHVEQESAGVAASGRRRVGGVVRSSLWSDAGLFSVSQAGLVNNLNDGLAWGIFPLVFLQAGRSLEETGLLAAVYPVTWGICQLGTGALSDRWGRKGLISAGMILQGAALVSMTIADGSTQWIVALVGLGVGTALVYPTLIAAVGDFAHPSWRGMAVGVYRMWRDLGYVAGALVAGVLTDAFGTSVAINAVGGLTVLSGLVVAVRLPRAGGRSVPLHGPVM